MSYSGRQVQTTAAHVPAPSEPRLPCPVLLWEGWKGWQRVLKFALQSPNSKGLQAPAHRTTGRRPLTFYPHRTLALFTPPLEPGHTLSNLIDSETPTPNIQKQSKQTLLSCHSREKRSLFGCQRNGLLRATCLDSGSRPHRFPGVTHLLQEPHSQEGKLHKHKGIWKLVRTVPWVTQTKPCLWGKPQKGA